MSLGRQIDHQSSKRAVLWGRLAFSICVWLSLSCPVLAAAPTLTHLFPAGGQRGTKVVVTCSGKFGWPVKVWSPGVEITPLTDSGKLEVSIPDDLPVDRVWIRLYNEEGASTSQPFLIGGLKEIEEVEPNNRPREAHSIAEPSVTVNGVLKDSEVDCFAVPLAAGQTLVCAVDANTRLGSPMDSILQVASVDGIVRAENHDDLNLDPRLAFTASKPGTYIVRLFAFPSTPNSTIRFNGSSSHIYRLTLTTGPYATNAVPLSATLDNPGEVSVVGWNIPPGTKLKVIPFGGAKLIEDQEFEIVDELRRSPDARIGYAFLNGFPGGARVRLTPFPVFSSIPQADANPITLPVPSTCTACLGTRRQADEYRIPLTKGQQVVITAESRSLDVPLDPLLKFADPSGTAIAEIDDSGSSRDALIVHTAAHDGDYRLTVSDRYRQGGDRCWYLLTIRIDKPDFELTVSTDTLTVPADKPAELPVKVVRRGPAADVGPITIQAVGLPEGITSAAVVSETAGPTASEVKLTLASSGTSFSGPIRIIGKAAQLSEISRSARTPPRLGVAFDAIWLTALEKPK